MSAQAATITVPMSDSAEEGTYNYKVVRQFAIMTVVWGIVGMLVGVIIATQLMFPDTDLRHSLAVLRPPAPAAHQRGDLRVRRIGTVRHQLLRRPAHLPYAPVLRHPRGVHVLGLAGGHRRRGHHPSPGLHDLARVRRTRMADRHPDHAGLGLLRDRLLRHDRQAQDAAHLRRQLVLRRVHPDRCAAAHRQQRRDPRHLLEVLLRLFRRAGCDGANGGTATTPSASS